MICHYHDLYCRCPYCRPRCPHCGQVMPWARPIVPPPCPPWPRPYGPYWHCPTSGAINEAKAALGAA